MKENKSNLKKWLFAHAVISALAAILIFIFPYQSLEKLGYWWADEMSLRLAAAAIFAIAMSSFLVIKKEATVHKIILELLITWSLLSILALSIELARAAISTLIYAIAFFALFSGVWLYYRFIQK